MSAETPASRIAAVERGLDAYDAGKRVRLA